MLCKKMMDIIKQAIYHSKSIVSMHFVVSIDHVVLIEDNSIFLAYCDIVPTPRNKWIPAKRYTESDIVFIIYTGANFYQTRATATRDTWLSRVTHKYFFSATP